MASNDPVWADLWNPDVNEWSPSDEPEGTFAQAEPSHFDVPSASPMEPGESSASLNLLTDVARPVAQPPPPQIVHHEVLTTEAGAEIVRSRTIVVPGNTTVVRLLDPNLDRKRALIKVVSATAGIQIGPMDEVTAAVLVNALPPTVQTNTFFLQSSDGTMEIKSSDGVDCLGCAPTGTVLVTIWEELNGERAIGQP